MMAECAPLKQKTYSFLTDNNDENKKAKGIKMSCHAKKTYI